MNYFEKNMIIINKRWPNIVKELEAIDLSLIDAQWLTGQCNTVVFEGIQISSSYDAYAEAEIQCQQIPLASKKAYLYGMGLGQVQQLLLAREKIENLDIVVMNFYLLAFCLSHVDQCQWLEDERVQLHISTSCSKVKFPFIALPAELVTVEDRFASLRDRLCLELDQQFISKTNSVSAEKVVNSINKNSQLLTIDADIVELSNLERLKSKMSKPDSLVVVTAAGPSLSDHYHWLKQNKHKDNMIIIAVDASVKPLLAEKIIPDIIVSIDQVAHQLFTDINMKELAGVPLVYFPLLDNKFLQNWPGPRFVSLSSNTEFDTLSVNFTHTRLFSAGSVIHPTIDLAVKLLARKILLLGADFSLIRQQTHVSHTEILSERELLSPQDTPHWIFNGRGKKVPTYLNFRGYLRDLESYIEQQHQTQFFTGSLDGANIIGAPLWPDFCKKTQTGAGGHE
jgi:hypothetical protein